MTTMLKESLASSLICLSRKQDLESLRLLFYQKTPSDWHAMHACALFKCA